MESKFESLWLASSSQTTYPVLEREIDADVAIIGGGIAGLMAAYSLTREGKKVVVLETNRIATGTTGYTTAKVTSLHDAKYHFIKENFGIERAKIYGDSNQWAIAELEKIVRAEEIDCAFMRAISFLYTNDPQNFAQLENEYKTAKEIGLPASLAENIPGMPFGVKKALKFSNQAEFHPRNFLIAIAKIITKNGGHIFENSKVEKIKDGEPCAVITAAGKVKATGIIVATNYPIYDTGLLFLKMGQMRSYALAFQTNDEVSPEMFIGLGDEELTIRTYQENKKRWVIVGGEAHPVGQTANTDEKYKKMEELARKYFKVQTIDYKWSAQDAAPLDRIPLIGKMPFSRHVFVTTGYNEWGMTTSIMSAKLLTDLILKKENAWQELYSPSRLNVKAMLGKTFEHMIQLTKGYAAYIVRHDDKNLSKMKVGEGRIINSQGEKIAVCKDDHGKLCALSGVCTHLGCIVQWNKAEMSWDCPCHGSRFDLNGTVIHGPAVKNLEKKEIDV